jgi:pilus assembly protein CpaE
MAPHVSVVLIDSDQLSRKSIEVMLNHHQAEAVRLVGSVSTLSEGLSLIRKTSPSVAIVEVKDIESGVRNIANIRSAFPRVSIFATSSDKTSETILKVMRAGAMEYLLRPVSQDDLEDALQKIGRLRFAEPEETAARGSIISVYNPMGGSGVTTLAVNLAASLISRDAKVVLVDLNCFSGDVSAFLDLRPEYTLSTVASNITRLDDTFLTSVLTVHPSGIHVLAEPREVYEDIVMKPEEVVRVLTVLKNSFTYVIVDTGGHIHDHNMTTFRASDMILFVFSSNLPSLTNSRRYLSAMDRIGVDSGKIRLVVNRFQPKDEIKLQDIEKVLGREVFMTIPNDYKAVVGSINKGVPVVKLYPNSLVSKGIIQLADAIKESMPVKI